MAFPSKTINERPRRFQPKATRFDPEQIPWKAVALAVGAVLIGALIGYLVRGRVDNPPIELINTTVISSQDFARRCEVAAGAQTLKAITNEELTLQLAKKLGVMPSDDDVNAKYITSSQQPSFAQQLADSGLTMNDVKRKLMVTLAQQNIISQGVNVNDADVQAFYNENIDPKNPNARYSQPDRVQIAAIITSSMADHDTALHLLASGAAFAAVAQRYSKDSSAQNGGVLPAIRKGSVNSAKYPGLENAIFALSPGQQIDTYQNANSIWIIRCVAHQNAFTTPFSQVESECRLGALLAKGMQANGAALQSEMQSLEQSSQITVFWPQYKVISSGHS